MLLLWLLEGRVSPARAHRAENSHSAKQVQSHKAQARAGPALGQGQYLQLSSCQPAAQGHRTEANEGGRQLRGVSGNTSPHTQREYGPGLLPLKSLKDAAAETRQVGQRGHSKTKGKARTSLEWGQGNCLSLPQLPVHPPQPLRCRKQA